MITIFDIFDKITGKKKAKPKKEEKKEPEKKNYSKEIQENVSIHVMPERFRVVYKQKDKAKTTGIFIIIGGILILAVILFLAYYFLLKPSPPEVEQVDTPTDIIPEEPEPIVPIIPEPEEEQLAPVVINNPKDSYTEIKVAFDNATVFDEYDIVVEKYGSRSRIEAFKIEKREVENMPTSFKNNIISLVVQQGMPKFNEIGDIIVVEQEDRATINATTKDLKRAGVIQLVFEDNEWKLDSESWEDVEEENPEEPIILSNGVDSDRDGLTDKEEQIFSSNISGPDSDGDGYNDLSEVNNLYNPAGEGGLEDNDNITKYNNGTYNYSFLYPEDWITSSIGGGETIMFRSSDNHFIQIVVQANIGKQSIEDWYRAQFNVATINSSKRVSKNIWQGVKSDDGLNIYITDSSLNNIYVITYNLGNNDVLEYKNIFELVINSFEIGSF